MIKSVLILGSDSAGLLAAVTLKKKLPQLEVRVVRGGDTGGMGIGEGTTPAMLEHLFGFLGLSPSRFYAEAQPTWKLGTRFLWGPRAYFDYTFDPQFDSQIAPFSRASGFYADEDFRGVSIASALMEAGKVFARDARPGGVPDMRMNFGFHLENAKLVRALEGFAQELGVVFIEGRLSGVERGPHGIAALQMEDGQRLEADFFVDSSGFRSELIGRALGEEFVDYGRSLFCDRAVVGGWDRTTEPILPYTVAETMDAGWAWQIEHEHHVNRGYVYCSQSISDDTACEEFLRKNPKASKTPHVVKFRSGRHRRLLVENVVAIGDAAGFVEPLEATSLLAAMRQCRLLCVLFEESALRLTPTLRETYNRVIGCETFDDTRDFLALHYKLNTRLDNEFWRRCRESAEIGALAPLLEFYRQSGPNLIGSFNIPSQGRNIFTLEAYLAILLGNRAPYEAMHPAGAAEFTMWNQMRSALRAHAQQGVTVEEMLRITRSPQWRWSS